MADNIATFIAYVVLSIGIYVIHVFFVSRKDRNCVDEGRAFTCDEQSTLLTRQISDNFTIFVLHDPRMTIFHHLTHLFPPC